MTTSNNSWRWIQFSDIHIGSPKSFRFQPAWNENFEFAVEQVMNLKVQPDFVFISGDMCRDGDTHPFELEASRKRIEALPWPAYWIPGNHDVGGRFSPKNHASVSMKSHEEYRKIFGNDWHTFTHKGLRMIGIDSMILGSNLTAVEEQWTWLERQAQDSTTPTVVVMHSLPFTESPGKPAYNLEDDYNAWYGNIPEADQVKLAGLFKKMNLLAVTCGHIHVYDDIVVDGIRRVMCPATAFLTAPDYLPGDPLKKLGFLEWVVEGERAEPTFHELNKTSDKEGYGPGGNIAIEERDYSLAWEK